MIKKGHDNLYIEQEEIEKVLEGFDLSSDEIDEIYCLIQQEGVEINFDLPDVLDVSNDAVNEKDLELDLVELDELDVTLMLQEKESDKLKQKHYGS